MCDIGIFNTDVHAIHRSTESCGNEFFAGFESIGNDHGIASRIGYRDVTDFEFSRIIL